MKKSLFIAAGVALMVTLSGCPGGTTNQPNPSANPSASPSEEPTATPTPSEGPTSTPTPPLSTPTPLPSGSALPTPEPGPVGFSISGATATKQSDFTFIFNITGTDLGAIADYQILQVENSGSTIELVRDGKFTPNVELRELSITPTGITFRWLTPFGAPTSNDLLRLHYTKVGETTKNSTSVRLSASR
ncbi:MAG: hypothetical protein CVV27_02100 [Candidatus Melainabacteria bacterium HGW-Melainabacteria-1]|nr:MAG: hypothetical protein CVV27_02100 [Candidatus Melainabacteria bacterium HGW-Melainabacteria-1]